jgi:hypothetical protein
LEGSTLREPFIYERRSDTMVFVARLSDVLVSGIDVYVTCGKECHGFFAFESDLQRAERPIEQLNNEQEGRYLLITAGGPRGNRDKFLEYASRTMMFQIVTFGRHVPKDAVAVGLTKNKEDLVIWPYRWVDGYEIRDAILRTPGRRSAAQIAGALGITTGTFLKCAKDAIEAGFVDVSETGMYHLV